MSVLVPNGGNAKCLWQATILGPVADEPSRPHARYLVHFRSRDLSKLHSQGQFWHIFFTGGGAIINQDEIDTWTVHCPITLEQDVSALDPKAMVYKVLGSQTGPCPIEIDEILVTSVYRPNLVVADTYRTDGGRIFLAGDSGE